MAQPSRDQRYLGLDSNVLLAYLLPDHPDHPSTKRLTGQTHVVNPTVIHETYHAAVFKLKRRPELTVRTLLDYLKVVLCLPISAGTVEVALRLALRHTLGGRDALILASYLLSREVDTLVTMDNALLGLREVRLGKKRLHITSPTTVPRPPGRAS